MNAIPLCSTALLLAWLPPSTFAQAPEPPAPVELKLLDVSFHVSVVRSGDHEVLRIATEGLAGGKEPRLIPIEGKLGFSAVADLNGDGSPEI